LFPDTTIRRKTKRPELCSLIGARCSRHRGSYLVAAQTNHRRQASLGYSLGGLWCTTRFSCFLQFREASCCSCTWHTFCMVQHVICPCILRGPFMSRLYARCPIASFSLDSTIGLSMLLLSNLLRSIGQRLSKSSKRSIRELLPAWRLPRSSIA
jgi:hypothetical protein